MMVPDIPAVMPDAPLESALRLLQGAPVGFVAVSDRTGRFVGYLTPENISELVMIGESRERHDAGSWLRG